MEKVLLCEAEFYYKGHGERVKKRRTRLVKVPNQFWGLDEDSQRHLIIGILGLDKERLGINMFFREQDAILINGEYYTESRYVYGAKE